MNCNIIKNFMISSGDRITRAFINAKTLDLSEDSKYIIFSDCHRGDNSFADDFSRNRDVYCYALLQYLKKDFTYVELGDGDELWENKFPAIFEANKDVYLILKKFYDKGMLHFIWGNHDMDYRKPEKIAENLYFYFDSKEQKEKKLMIGVEFSEAIRLIQKGGSSIFLLHGHQADWFNYNFWKLSRFLVRILWKPLQVMGVKDPTSPAQNYRNLIRVEYLLEKWIKNNDNQMVITGHTHRPRFPTDKELPHFNDGSCVHPKCITGLEIENNKITLVKWHSVVNDKGVIKVKKDVLEGPSSLSKYI